MDRSKAVGGAQMHECERCGRMFHLLVALTGIGNICMECSQSLSRWWRAGKDKEEISHELAG